MDWSFASETARQIISIRRAGTHPATTPVPSRAPTPVFPSTAASLAERPTLSEPGAGGGTWDTLIARLGITGHVAAVIEDHAAANGVTFLQQLVVTGLVGEDAVFEAIAGELGVAYLPSMDNAHVVLREPQRLAALAMPNGPPIITAHLRGGHSVMLLSGVHMDFAIWKDRLARHPHLADRFAVVAPSVLRQSLVEQTRRRLLFDAQHAMFLDYPSFSARTVLSAWQGAMIALGAVLLLLSMAFAPLATLIGIQVTSIGLFLACLALRFRALRTAGPLRLRQPRPANPADLPVYSVLVALYREQAMVPQLLAALGRLQWPRSKLEIKLVCEDDDHETLAAIAGMKLRPWIEVVRVPAATPRTKPKALAYALPLCSGEFVALYDAEDRPHPLQLIEAWQHFRDGDDSLACVQAPLVVTNRSAGPLALMFAFEYAGLFRGLLPHLASRGDVLPLGGTSNHFRREALVGIGGWDSYNVTEDADLGLRLQRLGYRTDVISLPTLEDAPDRLSAWLPQRVRWFKGWMQTWLVHMREPVTLFRDLGPASFATMQILFLGMVASALVHPVFLATVLWSLITTVSTGHGGGTGMFVAGAGFVFIALGYCAFLVIGAVTLSIGERRWLAAVVLLTPFYWLLLSLAAWIAVVELIRRPHHWHKTPHRPISRAPARPASRR